MMNAVFLIVIQYLIEDGCVVDNSITIIIRRCCSRVVVIVNPPIPDDALSNIAQ